MTERRSLEEITGSPDYFARVSEIVQAIGAAGTTSSAVELLHAATVRMGAEFAVFTSLVPEDRSKGSRHLLVTCDPQWCSDYEECAGWEHDPWLAYALRHSEPILGHEVVPNTEGERFNLQLAERFGFRSSVIVPTPSSGGLARMGVLCLGSSTPGFFDGEGFVAFKIVARSVAMEFHEWWLGRLRDQLIAEAAIDGQDRRLLSLVAAGCSSKEIARTLDLSIAAIDSRFRRIRQRLDAPTRQSLARLAAEYGLIEVP
jgi:DNA-binding CsgD family transcriptional regulator